MHLLVTVGTTKFISLINVVMDSLEELTKCYDKVTIQTGTMNVQNKHEKYENLSICNYIDNFNVAFYDVVLCHCGTGSILKGLSNGKKVVCVVNETLKDNHQLETAQVFKDYVYVKNLNDAIPFLLQKSFPKCKKFIMKKKCNFLANLINS